MFLLVPTLMTLYQQLINELWLSDNTDDLPPILVNMDNQGTIADFD